MKARVLSWNIVEHGLYFMHFIFLLKILLLCLLSLMVQSVLSLCKCMQDQKGLDMDPSLTIVIRFRITCWIDLSLFVPLCFSVSASRPQIFGDILMTFLYRSDKNHFPNFLLYWSIKDHFLNRSKLLVCLSFRLPVWYFPVQPRDFKIRCWNLPACILAQGRTFWTVVIRVFDGGS